MSRGRVSQTEGGIRWWQYILWSNERVRGSPSSIDRYGAGDPGSARAAEWESENRVQQDVIRTKWHGQKSRLRGYELVTGQVSGCAERSSSKQARRHVADGNSIYMDACNNAPSRWIKLSKIVDCSFFHYIAVKRKLRRKDRVLQINNNNNNNNNYFLQITKHSRDVWWFAWNYYRRLLWHNLCRTVIFRIS